MDEEESRQLRQEARQRLEVLTGREAELLQLAMHTEDLRVRWNLIQVLGTIRLGQAQHALAEDWLWERLSDASPFTRTFALQALWERSMDDEAARNRVREVAKRFAEDGTAAMRARANRLLHRTPGRER